MEIDERLGSPPRAVKQRIEPEVARFFRWIVLPLAAALAVVGLAGFFMLPASRRLVWTDIVFRWSPILASMLLSLLAAWLRVQESLEPAYAPPVKRSLAYYFASYFAGSVGIAFVVRAVVWH